MMEYYEIGSIIDAGSMDLADRKVGNANLRELDKLRQRIWYDRSQTQLKVDSISQGLSKLKQYVNALAERLDSDGPIFSTPQWQPGIYPNLVVHEISQLTYHESYQLEIPYLNSPNGTNNPVWSEYGSSETHIACSIPKPVVDCEDSLNFTLPLEVSSDESNMNDVKLQSDDDLELTHSDINLSFNLDSLHHSLETNWRTKSLEQIRAENIITLKKRQLERAARLARDPSDDYPVCFNCGARFYWGHPCTDKPIPIEEVCPIEPATGVPQREVQQGVAYRDQILNLIQMVQDEGTEFLQQGSLEWCLDDSFNESTILKVNDEDHDREELMQLKTANVAMETMLTGHFMTMLAASLFVPRTIFDSKPMHG